MRPLYKTRLQTLSQTQQQASKLAHLLGPGDVVLLEGDLGVGKTTFARALIQAWMGDLTLTVPSPTFNLMFTYNASKKGELWHLDLYRLEEDDPRIETLGLEEACFQHVVLLEWPQRLGKAWLDRLDPLWVSLSWEASTQERQLTYRGSLAWENRLKQQAQ